jgi:hypothetical protein
MEIERFKCRCAILEGVTSQQEIAACLLWVRLGRSGHVRRTSASPLKVDFSRPWPDVCDGPIGDTKQGTCRLRHVRVLGERGSDTVTRRSTVLFLERTVRCCLITGGQVTSCNPCP